MFGLSFIRKMGISREEPKVWFYHNIIGLFPRPPPWKIPNLTIAIDYYIFSRRFRLGLFKSLSGDDLPPWSYCPHCKILFYLHPFLSGLPAGHSLQTAWGCLLGWTPGVYPLAAEGPFALRPYHKHLYLPTAFLYHICSPINHGDPTQLPMRKFDSYLPFVPTQEDADKFISTLSNLKPKAMVSLIVDVKLHSRRSHDIFDSVWDFKYTASARYSQCFHSWWYRKTDGLICPFRISYDQFYLHRVQSSLPALHKGIKTFQINTGILSILIHMICPFQNVYSEYNTIRAYVLFQSLFNIQ